MAQTLLRRWEALPARRQIAVSMPLLMVLLFGIHEAFFPLLTWGRSLTYAVMEAIPASLVVTFATQVEVARRAQRAERSDENISS